MWTSWKIRQSFQTNSSNSRQVYQGLVTTFNASLNKIVDVTRFLNVMIELKHPDDEQANKARFILTYYEESDQNFNLTRARTNEYNQIVQLSLVEF